MAKLNNDWWNAFDCAFDTEEDVIEFIYERLDTSDFEDSYNDMGRHREPNEMVKVTAEDKRRNLYDFMMELVANKNKSVKMDKQEMINLLKKNEIIPDARCSQEDLESLIDYEEIEMKVK